MKKLKMSCSLVLVAFFVITSSYSQDWADLNLFKMENAKIGLPSTNEKRVVFMGNSITSSWKLMCPEFFEGKPYVDRAISGQTTPQMLLRFRTDVIDLKPTVVVILAGTNDVAENTGPSTVKMIVDNIISMAELARANDIKVILSSVLPVFMYPWNPDLAPPAEKIVKLNVKLKDYADKNGILYIDYFQNMVDHRNGLKSEFTYDGVHPNKAGYKVMGPLAREKIEQALNFN